MQREQDENQKLKTVLVDLNLGDKLKASEYHDLMINQRLEVRYADGELERLGIVNIDPFDLNGQSKLYARFIDKSLSDLQLASFFSEFGEI
jgi:intein/homing endonuclease